MVERVAIIGIPRKRRALHNQPRRPLQSITRERNVSYRETNEPGRVSKGV